MVELVHRTSEQVERQLPGGPQSPTMASLSLSDTSETSLRSRIGRLQCCPRAISSPSTGPTAGRVIAGRWRITSLGFPCPCRKLKRGSIGDVIHKNGADRNVAMGSYYARKRCVLIQGQVRSTFIVILLVRTQQIAQMPFAKNDDVVEALTSDGADQPLRASILPR